MIAEHATSDSAVDMRNAEAGDRLSDCSELPKAVHLSVVSAYHDSIEEIF